MDGRYALSGRVHILVWIHHFPTPDITELAFSPALIRWKEVFGRETALHNWSTGYSCIGRIHIFPPSSLSKDMTPGRLTKHVLTSLNLSTVLAEVDWE